MDDAFQSNVTIITETCRFAQGNARKEEYQCWVKSSSPQRARPSLLVQACQAGEIVFVAGKAQLAERAIVEGGCVQGPS